MRRRSAPGSASPTASARYQFDASNGASALFTDILHIIPRRYGVMTEELCETVGRQLIDLLALALEADERTLTSHGSAVRASHLTRIDSFLRRHLNDPDLDPQKVAAGCGISVRYLHELLRDTNQTLGQWIRDQRLAAARERLRDPGNVDTDRAGRLPLRLLRPRPVLARLQGPVRHHAEGFQDACRAGAISGRGAARQPSASLTLASSAFRSRRAASASSIVTSTKRVGVCGCSWPIRSMSAEITVPSMK